MLYQRQQGASLGDRLNHAVRRAFDTGAQRAVVIGTDCPQLQAADIEIAFADLAQHDVVLGPALDGGYYLIGMSQHFAQLFCDIEWSTDRVFQQTLERCSSRGLKTKILRPLRDIDYPEDLVPLRATAAGGQFPLQSSRGRLSVIIPTLNEASHLKATLNAVGKPSESLEVIVVDAGSDDATVEVARENQCRVFEVARGRARQLNAGAAAASGAQLLFLHADTLLPKDYRQQVEKAFASDCFAGAFPLRIDSSGLAFRAIEWGVGLRCKFLHLPYGDQALFIRAKDFYRLGGFADIAIMEDYEFIDRLRRQGRIAMAGTPVSTSARRWKSKGILRTTLINQLCLLAYKLGCTDQTIARLYRSSKKKN